jgi:hypothetical protein
MPYLPSARCAMRFDVTHVRIDWRSHWRRFISMADLTSGACTAVCESQTGCLSHELACCTVAGHEHQKVCATPAQGYFVDTGVATLCNNMDELASVASCEVCTSTAADDCTVGTCTDGFHTYSSGPPSCIPCSDVANAEVDATYTCTTALDSRVSGCAVGYTRQQGNAGTMDHCAPNPCATSTTTEWTHEAHTNTIAPPAEMASGTTTTVECDGWHSGYRGSISLSCSTGIVSFATHECTHYDPCAGETDDCDGDGHICDATGPGSHSCSCPANSYGTATPGPDGTSCTPCTANSATTNGVDNVLVSACVCNEGYATNSNIAHVLGLPTDQTIDSIGDSCTAVVCPLHSIGYTEQWSGSANACTCNPGYFGPPVCDSAINGYSTGCTSCTSVVNAVGVTCDQADNSRAICETGYYLTVNSDISDTCSGTCSTSRPHCIFSALTPRAADTALSSGMSLCLLTYRLASCVVRRSLYGPAQLRVPWSSLLTNWWAHNREKLQHGCGRKLSGR